MDEGAGWNHAMVLDQDAVKLHATRGVVLFRIASRQEPAPKFVIILKRKGCRVELTEGASGGSAESRVGRWILDDR